MTGFSGYLFSKLQAIGSRSEGPEYFLQLPNYQELTVVKQVHLWEKDPALHPYLDSKVLIEGELQGDGIHYSAIGPSRERAESGGSFVAGGGEGPTPLISGDGGTPLIAGGEGGGVPLEEITPEPMAVGIDLSPLLSKQFSPLCPAHSGKTELSVRGLVKMYFMHLFGHVAMSIRVTNGVDWYIDYSGKPELIQLIKDHAAEIVNHINRIEGYLVYRKIGKVFQPVIVAERWILPVK